MSEQKNNQLAQVSKISWLSIIESKNTLELVKNASKLEVLNCVDSVNQLSKIKREQGEKYVLEQVVYILKWLNDAFTKNLNDSQIFDVSMDILNDYWYFKLEDIVCFAKEFRKGNILKIPYHLEIQHIHEGLKIYDQIRMSAINKRHNDIKQSGEEARSPEFSEGQKLGHMVKHISNNI